MNREDVYADLAAFADDEHEVVIEPDGTFLMVREGRDVSGRIIDGEQGLSVRIGEEPISYRHFLTRTLGRLDVLAARLLQRKGSVASFIEGPAVVHRPASLPEQVASAPQALISECLAGSPFATRVVFITADAGMGKSALLQQMQAERARLFMEGRSSFLFWHLDLQGRQLLRLSEALMGDLGELRMYGLWMPGVIRMMRQRALVLAIDGFDELSAEQGSNTSLGALAALTAQLDGQGTIVAAARRTFFDTEDYLRRAGMVKRSATSPSEFVELTIRPWGGEESRRYLTEYSQLSGVKVNADEVYDSILAALGGVEDHPFLTRPFLLSRAARAIIDYSIPVDDFIVPGESQLDSVAAIVNAFVEREVTHKWRNRVTGEPYLSSSQHRELLAQVAEEMYQNATDRLPVDVIDMIASMLLESWQVDAEYRQQVIEMVRMHVLLVPPTDGAEGYRSFDHPEFRDYFVAVALSTRLIQATRGSGLQALARFLSISQLSDSTARYVFGMLNVSRDESAALLESLQQIVTKEHRPTYVQVNVGTLLPFALTATDGAKVLAFDAKAITSSIAWENTHITDASLVHVTFVNASLRGAIWVRVVLADCELGDLTLDASCSFEDVTLERCNVNSVRIEGNGDSIREFSPDRIRSVLARCGFSLLDEREPTLPLSPAADTGLVKAARTLLSMFRRSTVVPDSRLRLRFTGEPSAVLDSVVRISVSHGVLTERTWKGSGQGRIWSLTTRLEDVLLAEAGDGSEELVKYWNDLRAG